MAEEQNNRELENKESENNRRGSYLQEITEPEAGDLESEALECPVNRTGKSGGGESEGEALEEEDPEKRRLREENERLREEIERVRSLPMKERLYDRIHVSLRTLDIFIVVMIVLGIIVTIIGMTR